MLISELSCRTGVSVRSLRYYESKKLLHSKRLENGYRDFDESAEERVRIIQLYFMLGLSTNDIVQIIDCPVSISNQQPLCEKAIDVYQTKLTEIDTQIEILQKLRSRLQERIANFERPNFSLFERTE